MDDTQLIKAAWDISTAMAKLNDLIWDLYEDDFIELFINPDPNSIEQLAYEVHQEESDF
jgi:hypothetical protein